ncbi:hypothetical protein GCM10025869_01460 [Homoserinibacter gongjuensis]|uniref:Preprotein translocase subunit SecE n=1 Tax=Homoserinibacter gongjuensis TaxID=1162968 RepID=A0ABQ6JPE8_9MICO|nr:hypothetical protein GCM10025869_01460 [Homoserinibacter gongjuensis]
MPIFSQKPEPPPQSRSTNEWDHKTAQTKARWRTLQVLVVAVAVVLAAVFGQHPPGVAELIASLIRL